MAITIGDAVLWIRGDSKKLDGDLKQAETATKSWGERIKGQLSESMNFAMGQIMSQGITQLANGIESLAKETIDFGQAYAQQVEDLARLSGTSAEDASRIIQVADDMRLSYGDVSTALKLYAKTQSETGQGQKMSIGTLARLSDQYLALAPGVDRANFLLQNFGRSGVEMGKLMEQGGDGIRSMAGAVDESLVLTEEGIRAIEEYRLAMNNWNDAIDGVKLQLMQALLPSLTELAQFAVDYIIPAIKGIVEWFKNLPMPAKEVVIAIGGLIIVLAKIGPALLGIVGMANMLGGGGILAGLGAAFGAISAPVWLLIAAIGALIAVIVIFGPQAQKTFQMVADIIAAALKRAGYEIQQFFKRGAQWASDFLRIIGEKFKAIGRSIVDGIKSGITGAWEGLKTWFNNLLDGLLGDAQNEIEGRSPSEKWARLIGKPMAQGIGVGFHRSIQNEVRGTMQAGLQGLLGSAAATTDARTMIGNVELHATLTQTERRLLIGEARDFAMQTILKSLPSGI